jgi:hypothetical protein
MCVAARGGITAPLGVQMLCSRGGRVVLYGSYEAGERLERVTKLWSLKS